MGDKGMNGLMYAILAGIWAVVLIPMWLRRHDERDASRATDRFARAMGSLSGRGTGSREVLMPGRPPGARDHTVTVTGPSAQESPAARAAQRRRRVLAGLCGLLLLDLVLVVTHHAPRWSAVVPVLLIAGFLITARRQVALAAQMRARQARRTALTDAARTAEARYAASVDAGGARRGGRVVDPAPTSQAVPTPATVAASVADPGWQPVAQTLPTYVTAPAATRVPRVIDLTTPGSWSGAAMVEQARATRRAEADDDGMRVETFEITREPVPAPEYEHVLDPAAGLEELVEFGDTTELEALVADPRTGTQLPESRRAAG